MNQLYFYGEFPHKNTIPLLDLISTQHKLYFRNPKVKLQLRNSNQKVIFDFQTEYNIIYLQFKINNSVASLLPHHPYEKNDQVELPNGLHISKIGKFTLTINIHPILNQHLGYYNISELQHKISISMVKKTQKIVNFKLLQSKIPFTHQVIPIKNILSFQNPNAFSKPIYTVSDPNVANIQDGNLQLINVGEVDILCIYKGNQYYKSLYHNTEIEIVPGIPNIQIRNLNSTIYQGQMIDLSQHVYSDSQRQDFRYTSLHPKKCDIQQGILQVLQPGNAKIKITLPKNSNYKSHSKIISVTLKLQNIDLSWDLLDTNVSKNQRVYGNFIDLSSRLPKLDYTHNRRVPVPNIHKLHYTSKTPNIVKVGYISGTPFLQLLAGGEGVIQATYQDSYYEPKTVTTTIHVQPETSYITLPAIPSKIVLPLQQSHIQSYSYRYALPKSNIQPINYSQDLTWKILDIHQTVVSKNQAFITLEKKTFRITYLQIGTYIIRVTFSGNQNWLPSFDSHIIEIKNT